MAMRDILRNNAGRRGQAFPGTLADKNPADLDRVASQLDDYATQVQAMTAVEQAVGNDQIVPGASKVADTARGEAARYRKTGWLRSR